MYNNFVNPYYPQSLVDIGQVSNEQEAVNSYVVAGRSKILFSTDDQTIYVKCVSMNGTPSIDIFDRRQNQPVLPASDYVTKEELNQIIDSLKSPKKSLKTEVAE